MGKKNIKLKEKSSQGKITTTSLNVSSEPLYITFNFSFLTKNDKYNLSSKKLSHNHKHYLLERIAEMSKKDMIELTANTNKKLGLEKIAHFSKKDKLSCLNIDPIFTNSFRDGLAGGGFWIFRLCPNNNPYETRIIGKLIKNTFYVMFIDCNHDLYAKRK